MWEGTTVKRRGCRRETAQRGADSFRRLRYSLGVPDLRRTFYGEGTRFLQKGGKLEEQRSFPGKPIKRGKKNETGRASLKRFFQSGGGGRNVLLSIHGSREGSKNRPRSCQDKGRGCLGSIIDDLHCTG